MTKLHIFDMDGTLLTGSACLHISNHVGKLKEVMLIEEAWGRGEVGHVEFYDLCLPLWGSLSEDDVAAVFRASPWLRNVEKVFRDIERRGEFCAVITLSPMFFVAGLQAWGATTTHGAVVLGGVVPDPTMVLTPESKVHISGELIEKYRLSPDDVLVYGDSASDVPLFQKFANTVSINGSEKLVALARSSYSGEDLWEAYTLGRQAAGV